LARPRTVVDFTDPYIGMLTPPPPVGDGVCDICHGAPNPGWTRCRSCTQTMRQVTHPTHLVVPISLYEVPGQLHHVLRKYKDGYTEEIRAQLRPRVASLLWRFLSTHGEHITEAAGSNWDLITSVPSSGQRDGQHPLERAIALVRPLAEQHEVLLERGPGALNHNQASDDGYTVIRNVEGENILVVDDTFTSGARIQSAASALSLAGANVVAAVPIGRVINPAFSDATRELWAAACARGFDFEVCALEDQEL
jgi:predicted amidophosphoribosyltransferase